MVLLFLGNQTYLFVRTKIMLLLLF